jgi:hypothetical protein
MMPVTGSHHLGGNMANWTGLEGGEYRDGSPWRVRHDRRWSWKSAGVGALVATCLIATSQALASVPGWIAPAIGAALVAIALVVL